MTQEVQIARPTPLKSDPGFTPGRRKANQIFKMAVHNLEGMGRPDARKLDVDIGLVYSLGPKFPNIALMSPESEELIAQLVQHLDQRIQKRNTLLDDYNARRKLLLHYTRVPCHFSTIFNFQRINSACSWFRWNGITLNYEQKTLRLMAWLHWNGTEFPFTKTKLGAWNPK